MRYGLLTLILTSLLGLSPAAVSDADEDVQFLLQYVSESGCTFIRNGERHESTAAADHLRMKYEHDRRHIKSAEQFIDRLASASSLSGQPYVVSCGGETQTSREWLNEALVIYHLNK
jgi:hypothetical protein